MNELKNICEFARANRVHFKAPHSVILVKELAKTATGMISTESQAIPVRIAEANFGDILPY